MEHFARSRFWRAAFVALVAAVMWLAWGLAGWRSSPDWSLMPVAHAGGVVSGSGVVYTTNEAGDVLYVWPTSAGAAGASTPWMEQWSWANGSLTRKPVVIVNPGIGPGGVYPGGTVPPSPGGNPSGRYGEGH